MTPLRFSFVLHIHQPVGNFDFVFSEHTWDVYRPFLDFLDERALWPVGLHVSGPLLEWMGKHDPQLHDRVGRMVVDEQVELLSSGWYEPVLAALTAQDRATQLEWMQSELESRFGVRARGAWLTERVWTSELVDSHLDAGLDYVLVDDHLLRRAGARARDLLGPCRADHNGRSLSVFPIDEELRYLIPFKPAPQVAAAFRRRHEAGDPLALFGDDGEKFGGWPRTKEWLYDRGWLKAFGNEMDQLRNEEVVRLVTPSQALDELDPGPRFQLPPGSYVEMDGWAQGPWTRFLDRYREAGRLHDWMSALSVECAHRGDAEAVRRAIGRAQCNDAYWHGVFGGLYMKHLREGVRGQMAIAERALRAGEALEWETTTDRAGDPVHWVHSENLSARVTGEAGGTLSELVWLDPHHDVTDVLTRRIEPYHEEAVARARSNPVSSAEGSSASIHDIEEEATLDTLPAADPDVRVLVRARVLGAALALPEYRAGDFEAIWQAPRSELSPPLPIVPDPESGARADRAFRWHLRSGTPGSTSTHIQVSEEAVTVTWHWDPRLFPEGSRFAPELSLGCPVELSYEPRPPEEWRYPIITVSKCPEGFEEIEQGTSVTPRWPVSAGRAQLTIRPPSSR